MRDNPDIDQLKRQARELLEAYRAQSPDAVIEVASQHRSATPETFALHDAQFVLARSYGFESWPKLKVGVDGVTTTRLHEAVRKATSARLVRFSRSGQKSSICCEGDRLASKYAPSTLRS
jgi:hypothetical protein